jgi:hypothetical protein
LQPQGRLFAHAFIIIIIIIIIISITSPTITNAQPSIHLLYSPGGHVSQSASSRVTWSLAAGATQAVFRQLQQM